MIYVSSSGVKAAKISESVKFLAENGFRNIELSGGTHQYTNILNDLLQLKDEYKLNYLCHNYFPPPSQDFVLNLASLDPQIYQMSIDHCQNAIDLSVELSAPKFGFHAGFLINIPINQIGKKIKKVALFDEQKAYETFDNSIETLVSYAKGKIELYIENNVLSEGNFERFEKVNPFFFTDSVNLEKIKKSSEWKPLVDVAHLMVSCNTLNLNFEDELNRLLSTTDYVHISDNDGKNDQNKGLNRTSRLFKLLKDNWQKGKTITLEVYDGIENMRNSVELIEELENGDD